MKNFILLSLTILGLASCKKEEAISPQTAPKLAATKTLTPTGLVPVEAKADTIPDNAIFKLKLVKDSINYDETMFLFNHTSSLNFVNNEDAPYFAGNGDESIASISNDGQDLALNGLPYTSGMTVGLDVHVNKGGDYSFQLSYINHIPSNIKIYVKDNMTRDSVDVRTGNYNFKIDESDTTSFSAKRFKLVIKDGGPQQVSTNGSN